jgi:hypothetical protein
VLNSSGITHCFHPIPGLLRTPEKLCHTKWHIPCGDWRGPCCLMWRTKRDSVWRRCHWQRKRLTRTHVSTHLPSPIHIAIVWKRMDPSLYCEERQCQCVSMQTTWWQNWVSNPFGNPYPRDAREICQIFRRIQATSFNYRWKLYSRLKVKALDPELPHPLQFLTTNKKNTLLPYAYAVNIKLVFPLSFSASPICPSHTNKQLVFHVKHWYSFSAGKMHCHK